MKKIKLTANQFKVLSNIYSKGGFIFVLSIIIAFGINIGAIYQCLVILACFFFTQVWFPHQAHSTKFKYCILFSITLFAALSYVAVQFKYSYTISAIIGVTLTFVSAKIANIQIKLNNYSKLQFAYDTLSAEYEKVKPSKEFDILTCSEEELVLRCRELNFTQENIQFCIAMFIKKQSVKNYVLEHSDLHLDIQQERNRKTRLKNKLISK